MMNPELIFWGGLVCGAFPTGFFVFAIQERSRRREIEYLNAQVDAAFGREDAALDQGENGNDC